MLSRRLFLNESDLIGGLISVPFVVVFCPVSVALITLSSASCFSTISTSGLTCCFLFVNDWLLPTSLGIAFNITFLPPRCGPGSVFIPLSTRTSVCCSCRSLCCCIGVVPASTKLFVTGVPRALPSADKTSRL